MLKAIGWALLSLALMSLMAAMAEAADEKPQERTMQRMEIVGGSMWILPELGAVIAEEDGGLVVKLSPPAQNVPKEYQKVDLQTGDQILMVNGKKVKTAKDIEGIYEGLAIGGELKLGIKRGGAMQIVAVTKADPEKLPKRRMMVETDDGPKGEHVVMSPQMQKIKVAPGSENVTPFPDAGMIIGEKDSKLLVLGLMPSSEELFAGSTVKKGDAIVSLQGTKVGTVAEFMKVFEPVKIGEDVKLELTRNGTAVAVSFTKPESIRRTIIRH